MHARRIVAMHAQRWIKVHGKIRVLPKGPNGINPLPKRNPGLFEVAYFTDPRLYVIFLFTRELTGSAPNTFIKVYEHSISFGHDYSFTG
jgi:hypothetical protein